ncbi:hypothetical protein C4565_07570 [Candidatus Parcubacteria bacterium]|jgi:hypothetical protein|nr:MAG: hypothetical protein C4565_07570 [Candidatus Parcubacteria bacterium]
MKHEPFKKITKEGKKVFEGLGIAFSVMIAAIGFFTFLFLAATAVRNFLERKIVDNAIISVQKGDQTTAGQKTIIASSTETLSKMRQKELSKSLIQLDIPGLGPQAVSDEYSYQTFHDFFSGLGWVDQVQTTLWHDREVSVFTLPPKYEWRRADAFKQISAEEACIQKECYVAKGLGLYRGSSEVQLPEEVRSKTLMTVSVSALDSGWRVGVVIKEDGIFKSYVYAFDGSNFKNIKGSGELFDSKYIGTIGIGGNDGGWLLVYGGYEGRAFQFLNDGSAVEIPNIFNTRFMDGGFVPGISKVGFGNDAMWYVWNKGAGKIKFIKLFQNGTNSIEGAVNLMSSLNSLGNVRRLVCDGVVENRALRCNADADTGVEAWNFYDYGFDNSKSYTVASANISNNILPVQKGTVTFADYTKSGNISIFLSNDGTNWQRVNVGEEITFKNQEANRIFWKMEYTPDSNPMYSLFLKSMRLDFKMKR